MKFGVYNRSRMEITFGTRIAFTAYAAVRPEFVKSPSSQFTHLNDW